MPAGPCSGINSATSIAWASDRRASKFGGLPLSGLLRRAVEAYRLHTWGGDEIVTKRTQPMLMQELAHALSRAERSVTRQLARAMEEEGCTVEDSRILLLLADGRGHTMTDVAEFALVPAPSVTRIVDRMVTDGLVHRTADPSDRRRVLVHLTPRGQALKRRLDEIVRREQDALLAGAETAETERLLGLLGGLADRLA
jgi:DNA-binding MarR family transcriptional regulator